MKRTAKTSVCNPRSGKYDRYDTGQEVVRTLMAIGLELQRNFCGMLGRYRELISPPSQAPHSTLCTCIVKR